MLSRHAEQNPTFLLETNRSLLSYSSALCICLLKEVTPIKAAVGHVPTPEVMASQGTSKNVRNAWPLQL